VIFSRCMPLGKRLGRKMGLKRKGNRLSAHFQDLCRCRLASG
jgi:hypothetical protein